MDHAQMDPIDGTPGDRDEPFDTLGNARFLVEIQLFGQFPPPGLLERRHGDLARRPEIVVNDMTSDAARLLPESLLIPPPMVRENERTRPQRRDNEIICNDLTILGIVFDVAPTMEFAPGQEGPQNNIAIGARESIVDSTLAQPGGRHAQDLFVILRHGDVSTC